MVKSEYLRENVVQGKLADIWSGPYEVMKVVNPNLYKINLPVEFKVSNEINIENYEEIPW